MSSMCAGRFIIFSCTIANREPGAYGANVPKPEATLCDIVCSSTSRSRTCEWKSMIGVVTGPGKRQIGSASCAQLRLVKPIGSASGGALCSHSPSRAEFSTTI